MMNEFRVSRLKEALSSSFGNNADIKYLEIIQNSRIEQVWEARELSQNCLLVIFVPTLKDSYELIVKYLQVIKNHVRQNIPEIKEIQVFCIEDPERAIRCSVDCDH